MARREDDGRVESRININDVQRAGFCVQGFATFMRVHRLDLRGFIKKGFQESDFGPVKDDANVKRLIAVYRDRMVGN